MFRVRPISPPAIIVRISCVDKTNGLQHELMYRTDDRAARQAVHERMYDAMAQGYTVVLTKVNMENLSC
jgi:hypothetical protein